jgi:hypothetical protein
MRGWWCMYTENAGAFTVRIWSVQCRCMPLLQREKTQQSGNHRHQQLSHTSLGYSTNSWGCAAAAAGPHLQPIRAVDSQQQV